MDMNEALATLAKAELLGFATGQPIVHEKYVGAANLIVAKLGTERCVSEIVNATEAFTDSHPELWHMERVPPIITKEQWVEVNALLMADEGIRSWLSSYLGNYFNHPPEDLRPFAYAFDELKSEVTGENADELADAVNRLSNRRVKELGKELGIKMGETTLRFGAYGEGLGLPLVSFNSKEESPVMKEADNVIRMKGLKERKVELLRTAIYCLLAYRDKVETMLDKVAGL